MNRVQTIALLYSAHMGLFVAYSLLNATPGLQNNPLQSFLHTSIIFIFFLFTELLLFSLLIVVSEENRATRLIDSTQECLIQESRPTSVV